MPIPKLSQLGRCLGAALLLATGASQAVTPTLNVSQRVLGTEEPLPSGWLLPPQDCGSSCRYASVSGAQMANGYADAVGAYQTANWPVLFSSVAPLYAAVDDTLAVPAPPAGSQYVAPPAGVWQRARVAYTYLDGVPETERQLDVQTWRSGRGASAVSYAVRIDTPAAGPRRTYLSFTVPVLQRDGLHDGYIAGPSGEQPFTVLPKRQQARTAVDVYVDGLPVWSSQSMRLRPQRYPVDNPETLDVAWGPALAGQPVKLFLGTLPAGSSRTAVLVMRSELRVDAPSCHTVGMAYGTDERHCDTQLEGLSLPSQSVAPLYLHTPSISVYTR